MARFQGLKRLNNGIIRKLTFSEISKGYIYITLDKHVMEKLGSNFEINVFGRELIKSLDSSGRIYVGKAILKMANKNEVMITLMENKIVIK